MKVFVSSLIIKLLFEKLCSTKMIKCRGQERVVRAIHSWREILVEIKSLNDALEANQKGIKPPPWELVFPIFGQRHGCHYGRFCESQVDSRFSI